MKEKIIKAIHSIVKSTEATTNYTVESRIEKPMWPKKGQAKKLTEITIIITENID